MDQERPKRRKCGPRVKTGCITCRIRRVKCDEGKPDCQRCVSTGRKCDGYVTADKSNTHRAQIRPNDGSMEIVKSPIVLNFTPDFSDSQRNRQLFHFYCVKSAFDLSVYLNSSFWHDMILQYSHYHPVIRQAVLAFGSAHMYALSMNKGAVSEATPNALEQAQQYDRAIRSLREYMTNGTHPDPHVILICCALFFSCENSRGNREAAWQHLENGLHILNSVRGRKSVKLLTGADEVDTELELVASKNGSKLMAKTGKVDVDEELTYVFSRLDVQATLCKESRQPMLNLSHLSKLAIEDILAPPSTFSSITDAQRSLDCIHNRLARFLSTATSSQPQDQSPFTPEPDWVENERLELNKLCANWEVCMYSFTKAQSPMVRQNLQIKHAPCPSGSPEWQLALQIQLLTLHHRCWWMLFRSYHNPSVFTISPNPRATEILDICEFLGFALPLRPSVACGMTEIDIAWKMISEIGVTAPLFVLATKCTDPTIRSRAVAQLTALRKHGNGLYHETFLDQVISTVLQVPERTQSFKDVAINNSNTMPETKLHRLQSMTSPASDNGLVADGPLQGALMAYDEMRAHEKDPSGLLGWADATSATVKIEHDRAWQSPL